MSDLTPGHVFASGETLTPARLNDLINFAQINPGAVTPEMLAAILDLSSKTLTLPNLSVTAAMLAAALDLSGKTLTMPATVISGLPAITSLEDTDYFWFWDATDSSLKKVSKATLTAAFQPAGTVLNKVYVETTARTTAMGAIIPNDDSVPQISEGTEILSLSITPKSASNTILVMSSFMLNSTGYGQVCALFRAGTNDALDVGGCYNSSYAGPGSLVFEDSPATTSAITYSLRVGAESANICYLNNFINYPNKWGSKMRTSLVALEIKG